MVREIPAGVVIFPSSDQWAESSHAAGQKGKEGFGYHIQPLKVENLSGVREAKVELLMACNHLQRGLLM